jgi:hypothetical protein
MLWPIDSDPLYKRVFYSKVCKKQSAIRKQAAQECNFPERLNQMANGLAKWESPRHPEECWGLACHQEEGMLIL